MYFSGMQHEESIGLIHVYWIGLFVVPCYRHCVTTACNGQLYSIFLSLYCHRSIRVSYKGLPNFKIKPRFILYAESY